MSVEPAPNGASVTPDVDHGRLRARAGAARGTAGASAPGSAWTPARRPGAASAERSPRLGRMPVRAELRPKGPYSLRLSGRHASDATRVVVDGTYRATIRVDDRLERVQAVQRADGTIVVAAESDAGVDHVRFALGLDDDHSEFVRRFANDPLLGETLRQRARPAPDAHRHRRAVAAARRRRAADPREPRARRSSGASSARRRRRSATCTRRRPPPSSARFSPAQLARFGLGARRAAALVRLCRTLDLEGLKHQPSDRRRAAARAASAGLGPWSVGVICLEGLGRYEYGLARDLGLAKLASALWGRWVEAEESDALLAPYGEWAGLASVYLLAGFQPRSRTLARCRSRLSSTSSTIPAVPVADLLAEQARPRRLDRAHRRLRRPATPTSAPRRSSRTGARSRSGGATSAASRPTTSARTTASRRRRCSTSSQCRRREVHRIRGELDARRGRRRARRRARGRRARPAAARARPGRRTWRRSFPARRSSTVEDRRATERPGRPRAVRRPRDDDDAGDPVGRADRLHRRGRVEGRGRRPRVRRRDHAGRHLPASARSHQFRSRSSSTRPQRPN